MLNASDDNVRRNPKTPSAEQMKARQLYRDRQDRKAENREAMMEARQSRSPQQQIALLDQRLGKGKGAKKERARLAALIKSGHTSPAVAPAVVAKVEPVKPLFAVGANVRINSDSYGKSYLKKKGVVVEVGEKVKVEIKSRKTPLEVSAEHLDLLDKPALAAA